MAIAHNPSDAPLASGGYSQGLEVTTPGRLLHISGQIPEPLSGEVPATFDEQCTLVWGNVHAVLRSAGMTASDLVKVTTFLADRRYGEANSRIRQTILGNLRPALTVVVTDIYDEAWLLEIEAIAFQPS